uniref:Late embryogenesis abundant protein LEA-2 subgroup domain-containing protein n=1 Tax=Oryza brachyantha TaxID=4533 RepID=J3N4F1_ORYBR
MLLLSLALAAAHLAVAYRTSCRERRRLLVYRIDVEAKVQNNTEQPSLDQINQVKVSGVVFFPLTTPNVSDKWWQISKTEGDRYLSLKPRTCCF